jgi:nucleoside-diphosphate-sugar epimerase
VLAGLVKGVDGEVFNVVDDDLRASRQFLRLYKKNAKHFKSIYVPHLISYALCYLWEKYSQWSEGQLPPVFNRRRWHTDWKKTHYSNDKLKPRLGWVPKVPTAEGLRRYIEACGRGWTACLRSPSRDAARSLMPTRLEFQSVRLETSPPFPDDVNRAQ